MRSYCSQAQSNPADPWLASDPDTQTAGLGECSLLDVTEILWLFGMRHCYCGKS